MISARVLSATCALCPIGIFRVCDPSMVPGEQEPWPGMSVGAVFYAVVYENARPPVPPDMPAPYAALMRECWATRADARPTFPAVQSRLSALFRELRRAAMLKAEST